MSQDIPDVVMKRLEELTQRIAELEGNSGETATGWEVKKKKK
jgi:hypothetical protein